MDYRVILYHKQATSARTRFLKFSHESICAFSSIPKQAKLLEGLPDSMVIHPAAVLNRVEEALGLANGCLKAEGEYHHCVSVPGETIQIILANITTLDPPFDIAEKIDARFLDLTQCRGLPQIELELLRHAYDLVMGG
ncbi:MAG: hypothetical protein PVG22_12675 [Chromatiales bacterium]|jgi:hypothetical protein